VTVAAAIVLWPRADATETGASGHRSSRSAETGETGDGGQDFVPHAATTHDGGAATRADATTTALAEPAVADGGSATASPASAELPHGAKGRKGADLSSRNDHAPTTHAHTEKSGTGPGATDLVRQANSLLNQGQTAEAARLCKQALQRSSGSAAAWACAGRASFEQGDHAAAVASYRHAVDLSRGNVRFRLLLAGALTRAGRTAEARREYEEVLRLDPSNAVARRMLDR
jgi:Flp pilus assembly protein TadD